jgi:hypothetical protein|nr:MAG TPA: minor capsid protein [Caudoviricetes sp.]
MSKDYDIEGAFQRIEEELINSMLRNYKRHRAWEKEEGFNWSMWQAEQLKSLQAYRKNNKSKFSTYFSTINDEVEEMIKKSYAAGNMDQEIKILKAIKRGYEPFSISEKVREFIQEYKGKPLKDIAGDIISRIKGERTAEFNGEFFKINDRKLNALLKATKEDFSKAEIAMLRKANDEYRKTIFNAQVYANTGAGTMEQAVDMATKDFLSKGINCIEYKNGARVNIVDYVAMALRTANKRAYLQGEGAKRAEWGIHTVIVTKRGGGCPKCVPFQGKVFIDDVWSGGSSKDGNYPLLSAAMKAGLFHPNCKDTCTTFFPGINTAPNLPSKEEQKKSIEIYNLQQKQKYAERKIRKYKRLEAGSCDERNAEKYKQKVSEYQLELQKHLSENKFLRRDTWREKLRDHSLSKNTIPAYLRIKNKERISKSDLEIIEKDLNKLPAKHKETLEEYISEIEVGGFENSGYDRKTRRVRLINDLEEGEIIHELGHALETKFDLYNNEKYKKLLYNVVKNKGYGDIIYDNETFTTPITRLQADRFVSEYQGRLYEEVEIFSDDGGINPKSLGEYFSEGYREFIENPEKLMEKDSELYKFIKELI